MKRLLVILGAVFALEPGAARAGLDLTWNDCVIESQVQNIDYGNCTTATRTIALYATFKSPVELPRFVAADLIFDFVSAPTPLPPFWRFDPASSGGCNSAGLAVRSDVEPTLGPCQGELSPWGYQGGDGNVMITGYLSPFGGAPRQGRLLVTLFRSGSSPYPLEAGTNYYMCHLLINSAQRQACAGCDAPMCIFWTSAQLHENDSSSIVVTGPDKLGDSAGIRTTVCAGDPVRKPSWGQLKSLYR
jgi:hypothetical protein